jgi:hypothetical protein
MRNSLGRFEDNPVYVCEDVSRLEVRNGLFYLTDDLGPFTITRAMRPHTFLKCVKGAYALAMEWERTHEMGNIVKLPAPR